MVEEIISDIIQFITKDIGYPVKLNNQSNLVNDAGMDSLDIIDLIGHLEAKFNVKFDENDHLIFKKSIQDIAEHTNFLRYGA